MSAYRIISADDHVQEPKDTWQARVPERLRDRAPKVVKMDGGDVWVMDGKIVTKMALSVAAGKKFEDYKAEGETYETIRPGAFDPYERVKDMDVDGVEAQVLFPNAFWAFSVEDTELQFACIRAYNDFLAEFCSANPRRLIGIGLVPIDDLQEGIREGQRIAKLGLRGSMLPTFPRVEPLNSDHYDPFWAAAQDLNLPIHLHLAVNDPRNVLFHKQEHLRGMAPAVILINTTGNMEALARLIFGGVMELVPKLKFVSVEGNVGWLPFFLQRADTVYKRHKYWSRLELPMPPASTSIAKYTRPSSRTRSVFRFGI
jgi:uncharacterized protein